MSEYKTVPTTAEVWAVIGASHPNLKLFGSFSDPDGTTSGKCQMVSSYGFENADFPLMETRTSWDVVYGDALPRKLINEKREYWLCLPKKEQE